MVISSQTVSLIPEFHYVMLFRHVALRLLNIDCLFLIFYLIGLYAREYV